MCAGRRGGSCQHASLRASADRRKRKTCSVRRFGGVRRWSFQASVGFCRLCVSNLHSHRADCHRRFRAQHACSTHFADMQRCEVRGFSQSRKSSRMPVCVFSNGRTKQGILHPEMRPNSLAASGVPHETGVQSILSSHLLLIHECRHRTREHTHQEECGEGREERVDGRRGTFKKAFDGISLGL